MPTQDDRWDQRIGKVLNGTYEITERIAQGGMGTVYAAVNTRLKKKRVALKVLHARIGDDPDNYARFRREAEIAAELEHPHIVEVIDFNESEGGEPYIVMENLRGEDLGRRLLREWRLAPALVLHIMEQVGSALQAAHERGIVHRDLKPENIFLVETGTGEPTAKVLDFGISKIRDSKSIVTRTDAIFGTPHFMSPEQAVGEVHQIDQTTDVFALGAICYQALSGNLPFDAPTMPGVIFKVCYDPQPPLEKVDTDQLDALNLVLAKALAKDKAQRYQRVGDFVEDLRRVLTGEGIDTSTVALATGPTVAPGAPLPPTVAAPTVAAPSAGTTVPLAPPGRDRPEDEPQRRRAVPLLLVVGLVAVAAAAAGGGVYLAVRPGAEDGPQDGPLTAATKPEPRTKPQPAIRPKPEPAVRVEPKPRPEAEPKPKLKPEPKPRLKPEPEPKPKLKPEPEPAPKPEPEPKPEPKPKPKPTKVAGRIKRITVQALGARGGVYPGRTLPVLRRHLGRVRACYNRFTPAKERGKKHATFVIDLTGDGQVIRIGVMTDLFQIPKAEGCVMDAAKRWRFPPTIDGEKTKLYPRYTMVF